MGKDIQNNGQIPPWIEMMRRAAMKAIKPEDVEEIVRAQVRKAKDGDKDAMRFVFEQVLGGAQLKGATFIQNVFHGEPDKRTKAVPGSRAKLDVMAARAAAGMPITRADDGPDVDLD